MSFRRGVVGWSLAFGVMACGGSSGEGRVPAAPAASSASETPSVAAPNSVSAASGSEAATAAAPVEAPSAAAEHASPASGAPSSAAGATDKPSAAKSPAAKPAGKPAKAASAASSGEPSSGASGARTFDCGEKGQKPCPLQGWMKANMAPAAASGNAVELAKQFDFVASHAPPGLANWASIAKAGASKASAADLDGAKAACKSCHDQYKAKYKAELRDRAL